MQTTANIATLAGATQVLWLPNSVYELRVLNTPRHTISGYFDDAERFVQAVASWDGKAPAVYVTLNPVKPALLARANNRCHEAGTGSTTADHDIDRRTWLPIDFDAIRPAGISASDEEHQAALDRAEACWAWLLERGCPSDAIVYADSGNGGHVLVRVDLPNDDAARDLMQRCLQAIALRFDDEAVAVDLHNYNAARIWKVYGTLVRKGEDMPERPHRRATLLSAPDTTIPAPGSFLQGLAATFPKPAAPVRHGPAFDIDAWMRQHLWHSLAYEKPWNGGHAYVLQVCPFNSDHDDKSAVVLQHQSGAVSFTCHHNGCTGRTWSELRALFEPREPAAVRTLSIVPPSADVHAGNGSQPPDPEPQEVGNAPPRFSLTDAGNGKRFAFWNGEDCLYCHTQSRWLVYDGTRYAPDDRQEVMMRAKRTVLRIYDEAKVEPDEDRRAELAKFAVRSENIARLQAMLKAAESERPVTVDELDTDLFAFNVQNGTLNLCTYELQPHRREDRISKLAPVSHDPQARCPLWLKTLDRIMAGNESKISYLQRFLGYCMTGSTKERMLAFFCGDGANGKSLSIGVVEYVFGDYAQPTQPEAIMRREHKEISNDIAMLHGARFVPTIEVEDGARLAESLVKQLTGGDRISARHLYSDFFTFRPTFKLCIAGNHKPTVKGTDAAIWERIHLVPFTVVIPQAERDTTLAEKLQAEASGILNWMLEGCRQWQRTGLSPPAEVRLATEEYREEMDILRHFLEERCVIDDRAWSLASDLYRAYSEWCSQNGERAVSQTRFGTALSQKGFEKDREAVASRRAIWHRIGLLNPDLEQLEGLDPFSGNIPREEKDRERTEIGGQTPPSPSMSSVDDDDGEAF